MMIKFLKFIAILIGLAVISVAALVLLIHNPMPNTTEMRQYFTANESAYIARTSEIERAISSGKEPEYRKDETLGYSNYHYAVDPFQIFYITHITGVGVGASGRGLAYLAQAPEKLYATFEAMNNDAAAVEGFEGYVHLKDGWYMYRWEAD